VYRLFDFRRVPPVAGRYINLTSEIIPLASPHLANTFFISPGFATVILRAWYKANDMAQNNRMLYPCNSPDGITVSHLQRLQHFRLGTCENAELKCASGVRSSGVDRGVGMTATSELEYSDEART